VDEPLVLIAEDDPSVRMTIELVLEGEGFRTLLAADGEEALQLATSELPDVILLDQSMPKIEGKQVVASLRRQEPFHPDELLARVRKALKSRI
jgi:DNA-binding response OmpR family regulator